jgi:hypothetical protein
MNEEPTQPKCKNCYVPITRNIHCKVCDTVIYVAWAFDDYESEPELRLEFIDRQRKDNITSAFAMMDFAKAQKFPKLERLAGKIKRLVYTLHFNDHLKVFERALDKAEDKARQEIESSTRAKSAHALKEAAKATEEAYRASKSDRRMTEFDTTPDRDRGAYVGFNPVASEPEDCPF